MSKHQRIEAYRSWLVTRIAARLDVDPTVIGFHQPFSHYGLDSMAATALVQELAAELGRPVSPSVVWSHPNVELLAAYLAGEAGAARVGTAPPADQPPANEPIAMIGMACRFPRAPDADAFWRLLSNGEDAVTEIPAQRWNVADFYDPDTATPGTMNTRRAAFVDRVDGFDPLFFGISPREAIQIDPQQRLMLELSWEALEDAATPPDGLAGSRTGIFFGVLWHDYGELHRRMGAVITAHTGTGQAFNTIANRVSYTLGLHGPSMAVDTACSSSLVAVDLACRSLRHGESTLALAGGVNLILVPETMVAISKIGALAPDGRCKSFDERADGYVRGEGAGVVVLKPLSRALADGDPVHALILGSAVNNDGASNGLTAPKPEAQEAMLRDACERAGVEPREVGYVEAHGTGTALGDLIEAKALGAILGAGRSPARPLLVGSVKTNIGHLESAAGIAGLIKTVLCIKHRKIPPNLHFERPNPLIPFAQLALTVPQSLVSWPTEEEPAVAGVSSFGWGGTNCHVVVEELRTSSEHLLPLAAGSRRALRSRAGALQSVLQQPQPPPLSDLCAAAARQWSTGPYRLALTAHSHQELAQGLDAFLEGRSRPGLSRGGPAAAQRLALVCGPQGSQWRRMGRELMLREPVLRAGLCECDAKFRRLFGHSPLKQLAGGNTREVWDQPDLVMPALFAIQVSLAALWRSWGIVPDAVVGHSVGEAAAAHIAGMLDLDDAVRVVYHYSRLMARNPGRSGMAMVELPAPEVQRALTDHGGEFVVSVHGSPLATGVTGEPKALDHLLASLRARGVRGARVRMDGVAHCPQTQPVLAELRAALSDLQPRPGRCPMISTVTAGWIDDQPLDGEYWVRNLRQPVLFRESIAGLAEAGYELFLELDPHPVLAGPIGETLAELGGQGTVLPSLRRRRDEWAMMLASLGELYTRGKAVCWQRLYPDPPASVPALAPSSEDQESPGDDHRERLPAEVFLLSARSSQALGELATATASLLCEPQPQPSLRDLCYTAGRRRSHHQHRLAAVAASRPGLVTRLQGFSRGEKHPDLVIGGADGERRPGLVFVFSGQGPQWWGMGRELREREAVFRSAFESCSELFDRVADRPLSEELVADESRSRLDQTRFAQPALFSLQLALVALYRSWGVVPDAVVGHSLGEAAAAQVAGVLSLEDAVRVVWHRGRLQHRAAGGMVAIELPWREAEAELAKLAGGVEIAAINSPQATVLTGDERALARAVADLEQRGISCRGIRAGYASHSVRMEPLQGELERALEGIEPRPPAIALFSTVSGRPAAEGDFDAAYWSRNIRQPVRFATAMECLLEQGYRLFLEISPHPVLAAAIRQCIDHRGGAGAVLPSLRRGTPEAVAARRSLAGLYVQGYEVDWERLYEGGGRCARLPAYPWQRRRYWLEPAPAPARPASSPAHENLLLGRRLRSPLLKEIVFESQLSTDAPRFLADHCLAGRAVLGLTTYLEMLRAGAAAAFATDCEIRDLVIDRTLVLPEDGAVVTVQLAFTPPESGVSSARLFSREEVDAGADAPWLHHATARIRLRPSPGSAPVPASSRREIAARCRQELSPDAYYRGLRQHGFEYGTSFRGIEQLWRCDREALSRVRLPQALAPEATLYPLHPALLDAALHLMTAMLPAPADGLYLPVGIECFRLGGEPGTTLWSHGSLRSPALVGAETLTMDLRVFTESGRMVAEIEGMLLKHAGAEDYRRRLADDAADNWFYRLAWRDRAPLSAPPPPADDAGWWLVFTDRAGLGAGLAEQLERRGVHSVLVAHGAAGAGAGDGVPAVDPACPEDFAERLRALVERETPPCRGIVHLWSLDLIPAQPAPPSAPPSQLLSCGSVLHLVRTLANCEWREQKPPRMWLVTRGCQAVTPAAEPLAPVPAPLWGLGRVVAREHPELWGGLIDLDPEPAADEPQALLEAIWEPAAEDQLALRGGRRLVPRLVRSRPATAAALRLHADAAYLITGGLGALGLAVARWLVEGGARHLVLVGRSAPSAAAHETLQELERAGAQAIPVCADVAEASQLEPVLERISASSPPLRGIVHAAGILHDGVLVNQGWESFAAVLAPKIAGAWNLHALTRAAPLDFFVLFSSAVALLGPPGQGSYAAANAFLDALAHYRRRLGMPAVSINWGPWAEVGMAAALSERDLRWWVERGIRSIPPARGLTALAAALRDDAPQTLVLAVDWQRFSNSMAAGTEPPLWAEIAHQMRPRPGSDAAPEPTLDVRQLQRRSAAERQRLLLAHVRTEVAGVLGLPPRDLDPQQRLFAAGMDSLMAIELKNRLERTLGHPVPTTVVFTEPTIQALSEYLAGRLGGPQSEPAVPPREPPRPAFANGAEDVGAAENVGMAKNIRQLSEAQAEALLADKLAAIESELER